MKYFALIVFSVISFELLCQNEDKIWYFGPLGAGLDFRNCTPVVKTNGNSNAFTEEGAVSICDASSGRLLFYSTGTEIVDSTFNLMQNGLNIGNGNSGTQCTIVRKPGSANIFYYFVTDIQGGGLGWFTPTAKGLSYAIIDMTLNGGLGAVVSSHNPIKDTSNCEKLTAIKHANGTDVWLIAHEYRNNNFLVYSITNTGINLTPLIINVGPVITATQSTAPAISKFDAIGELKASPNGNKLAFTTAYNGITCLFDFNKSTGAITSPIPLSLNGLGGYGVSFSPDNQKLYISCLDTASFSQEINSEIVQFDLSSNNTVTIQNSRQVINFCGTCSYRSLKLAPDGKIYCAKTPNNPEGLYLAVINAPNNAGLSCNYVHNGVYLNGTFGSWGLNNLMESNNYCTTTGIQDKTITQNSKIFYDNSSGCLKTLNYSGNLSIKIYDISGKMVKQRNLDIGDSQMSTDDLDNGIYIISLYANGQPQQQIKFFKN